MTASSSQETLDLSRVINASIERVFDAWTRAEVLAQWFGPVGFEVIDATIDCRPAGKYSITLVSPEETEIKHYGEYLEVRRPHRLVFTWILENQDCGGSAGYQTNTIVEINFTSRGDQTLITLRHEKLPDVQAKNGHRFGWISSFDSLERLLN